MIFSIQAVHIQISATNHKLIYTVYLESVIFINKYKKYLKGCICMNNQIRSFFNLFEICDFQIHFSSFNRV